MTLTTPGGPPGLPEKRLRATRTGPPLEEVVLELELTTPVLGGGYQTRHLDDIDKVRVPSLRGALRFWWRALYGHTFRNAEALAKHERALWGGAGEHERDDAGRCPVTIEREAIVLDSGDDQENIRLGRTGAYALWPARETRGDRNSPSQTVAPRRNPGFRFRLKFLLPKTSQIAALDVEGATEPQDAFRQVKNAIRAWLLFGGYGGRTRRGVGSLTVFGERECWLPAAATPDALKALFGFPIFGTGKAPQAKDLPLLCGACLWAGSTVPKAEAAWIEALGWVSDFRQGQPGHGALHAHDTKFARDRGDNQRPGRSNWPESDKVRNLSDAGPWAHDPRHGRRPAWPRAGFGLPIIGQFQGRDRYGKHYPENEPRPWKLHWRRRGANKDEERLASPLIVKAMPLADGRFVPIALWMNRAYPDGMVRLSSDDRRAPDSEAAFDVLVSDDDARAGTFLFEFLDVPEDVPQGSRLKTAFFNWLQRHRGGVKEVTA